jgi:O-antigen/teichoic acid export membrane protein
VGGIQIAAILIVVLRSKLVAMLLGPQGVGVVSIVDQVVQLIAYVSAFSLPAASVRFLSKAHSESETRFRELYAAFLKAIVALAGAGALIGAAIAIFLPHWLGEDIARYRLYIAIAVLAVPAMLVGGFIPNVLAAAQKVRASAVMAVISNAGLSVGCIVGILAAGVAGMYAGSVFASTLIGIGGLLYLRASLHVPVFNARASVLAEVKANRDIVFVSAMFALTAVASSGALLVMRQAVLGAEGEAAAGLLQSDFALALAIGLVLNPTNGLYLTPILNRNLDASTKISTALDYQARLAGLLVLASSPMVLFPKTCLVIIFSEEFAEASQWVYLFVLAQLALQIAGVYQAVLIGLNELYAYAVATFGGHFVVGATALILAPRLGVEGAGVALLAGSVFTALASLFWLQFRHDFVISLRRFTPVMYALIAVGTCGYLVRDIPEWTPAAFAARMALGIALIVGAVPFFASELRDPIQSFVRKLSGRSAEVGD